MWFNAWLYRVSLQVHSEYPTYVDAFNEAFEHMTQLDKLIAVGTQPLLFVIVAVATIGVTRRVEADG